MATLGKGKSKAKIPKLDHAWVGSRKNKDGEIVRSKQVKKRGEKSPQHHGVVV